MLTVAIARNDSGKVLGSERPRIGAGHHLEMGLWLRWVVKSRTDVLVIAWPGGHRRPRRAAKHFLGSDKDLWKSIPHLLSQFHNRCLG